jgi:hypothetical protein
MLSNPKKLREYVPYARKAEMSQDSPKDAEFQGFKTGGAI